MVEMLVSVALFSIVVTIALGAIVTIVDVNRKSQSLTQAMNNFNFALESMFRTISTGDIQGYGSNSITVRDQNLKEITYSYDATNHTVTKKVGSSGLSVPIISEEVYIEKFLVAVNGTAKYTQPRILLNLKGYAQIGPKIKTDFNIQSTVSQRVLNI